MAMESQIREQGAARVGPWLAVALCVAVAAAGLVMRFVGNRPDYAENFGPYWLPVVAGGLAAAVLLQESARWLRLRRTLLWAGLLLMVWAANGLLLDLLRVVGLIPLGVDWPGFVTRALALAAVVVLARLVLDRRDEPVTSRSATWYGYAAFVLALAYPFFRTVWVFGGTLGLTRPGAAGQGIEEWLACTPWLLAAALSLLLITKPRWIPRRLLLTAGYGAAAVVATFGPAAFWSVITALATGRSLNLNGIESWVPCLFYGSWFLWGIAAAAATRSYQVRTTPTGEIRSTNIEARNKHEIRMSKFETATTQK